MDLQAIQSMWASDSVIDPTKIQHEAINISSLHSKYINILSQEKLRHSHMQEQYKILYVQRWKFYHKMQPPEMYKEYDGNFFDLKLQKEDKKLFVDSDQELVEYKMKLAIQQEKIDLLSNIIKMIEGRTYHIKNYIDYVKFQAGC